MRIKNAKPILKNLSETMGRVSSALERNCENISEEERNVFDSLNTAINCINNYVCDETSESVERRFIENGLYYDNNCHEILRVTKITDKSVYFNGARTEKRAISYKQSPKEYAIIHGRKYQS